MVKFYAKQVDPEWQEENLFYQIKGKDKRTILGFNDDIYEDNVIIVGNNEYLEHRIPEYQRLLDFDNAYFYEYGNTCYWANDSEFINCYLKKSNGKQYSTIEIHKWKELFKKYEERNRLEDIVCEALELMTGKQWYWFTIRGCMQREWQCGYASEIITRKDIDYIEMCYFNTGSEYIVYENKEDFDSECNGCSYYVDSYNSKSILCELLGCEEDELEMYDFDGYTKTPKYKLV